MDKERDDEVLLLERIVRNVLQGCNFLGEN